uniref:Uncharacterized protein n=1 Tax=Molossus molossus TaxID=27622 RepID=A0A7J8GKV2_MOLMO|nr:hypothetical protein HJG59_011406 [Molossus molossus]
MVRKKHPRAHSSKPVCRGSCRDAGVQLRGNRPGAPAPSAETPGFSGPESGFRRGFSPVVASLWSPRAQGALEGSVQGAVPVTETAPKGRGLLPERCGLPGQPCASITAAGEQEEPLAEGRSAEGQADTAGLHCPLDKR